MQEPTTENDYQNFNFDKDELPMETTKNQEGLTSVNFLTDFLKANQKEKMLQKQDEHIPPGGKAYIKKLSEVDEFDLTNTIRTETQRKFDNEVRGTGVKTLPTSKTANKVEILKAIIKKHNKKTIPDILQCIIQSGDRAELELFRTLSLGPNFQLVLAQAVAELNMESKHRGDTFIDHFIENCKNLKTTHSTLHRLFTYFCSGAKNKE